MSKSTRRKEASPVQPQSSTTPLISLNHPNTMTLTRYDFGGASKCNLEIKNEQEKVNVAFKIKTTDPKIFTVKPITGIIPPGMIALVKVQLLVTKKTDKEAMKNKFMIQTAVTDLKPQEVSSLFSLYRLRAVDPWVQSLSILWTVYYN